MGGVIAEDVPAIALVCLADGPLAEAVYRDWATHRPGFDVLVVSWPDGSASGHDRLLETVMAIDTPYAIFGHGASVSFVPELVTPGAHSAPLHVFLTTTSPPPWSSGPVGSADVPLTLLTTAGRASSAEGAMVWRERWDGAFHVRVFEADDDFLMTHAADVVSMVEEELLVLRPTIPEALPATKHLPA